MMWTPETGPEKKGLGSLKLMLGRSVFGRKCWLAGWLACWAARLPLVLWWLIIISISRGNFCLTQPGSILNGKLI